MNVHENARLTPRGREADRTASGRFASGLTDIAMMDWRDCGIVPPGRIGFGSRRPRPWSRRSNGCAASAGPADQPPTPFV